MGVGWALWGEAADLSDSLVFQVNYLGGDMCDIALNFSRPAGQVVCQYYNFLRPGREAYRKVHAAPYETAQFLAREIDALGPFEIICGGCMDAGILALCWQIKPGSDPGFNPYDLADRLRARGWQVPAYMLFLALGYLAFVETRHAHGAWPPRELAWWLTAVNLLGCVAFMVSALCAFVPRHPGSALLASLALVFTLTGAMAFLLGALLLIREAGNDSAGAHMPA